MVKPWQRSDGRRRSWYYLESGTNRVVRVGTEHHAAFEGMGGWRRLSFKAISCKLGIPYALCEIWSWWVWKDAVVCGVPCKVLDMDEYERVLREAR